MLDCCTVAACASKEDTPKVSAVAAATDNRTRFFHDVCPHIVYFLFIFFASHLTDKFIVAHNLREKRWKKIHRLKIYLIYPKKGKGEK